MFCGSEVCELPDNNEFQIEMIERLARVEEKISRITDIIPLIEGHTEKIARMDESLKSAHKRINELEKEIEEDLKCTKNELTELRNYKNQIKGMMLALCAVSGIVGFVISAVLRVIIK